MTIIFPNSGENLVLEMIVNKTAAQNLVMKLYSNNVTIGDATVAANFTEATFSGYAAKTLTGASWNAAASGSITYAQQTYACDNDAANESIYGYFVTQVTSGTLLYAEAFTDGPYTISNNGDQIKVTPTITAD